MEASKIPPIAEVQARLKPLTHSQLKRLERLSGVSFTTLWSIQQRQRTNPGIQTCAQFWDHIPAAIADDAEPLCARLPSPGAAA